MFNSTLLTIDEIKKERKNLKNIQENIRIDWNKLTEFVSDVPEFLEIAASVLHIDHMIESFDELDALDRIDILLDKMIKNYRLESLKDFVFNHLPKDSNWSDVLTSSVLNGWADEVVSHSHHLRSFERSKILDLIEEFKIRVENHRMSSRQAVHQAFAKRWSTTSDRTGVPLLKKEANKQRRVLSPREIMEKGALITMLQLKPCWLMSPLSISQMLPLRKALFDVIIFDEASQVRVEDAIPSIFRANTMIVVGDKKQMPPTNFFSGLVVEDEDEEEEISPSVLDLAMQVFPSVLLEWHYRSRSESLIAFSNRAFYGGRLIAAPNPNELTAGGAIKYIEVGEAYFTSKTGNVIEAEAVIDYFLQLLKENPNQSYGIVAFGQPQAVALYDALERRISENDNIKNLVEEAMAFKSGNSDGSFFIKNLENVQGDERDVIIISVGYAPSAKGKKLRLSFGPLSMQGGGRRLNVAITRAKSKMYIFSSFSPANIPTDEETFLRNPNLCVFGRYLKYAQAVSSEKLETALGILNSFGMSGAITSRKSSRFALDVKRRLEEHGYNVSLEIGTSGFFIDLAIHHPTIPSNFILGIECDGAMFHSTPYARDRDKIREDLLKKRGWKIERIWSQDWSKDWKKEVKRLDDRIKEIIANPEK